jgi:hypothetical protein
LKTFSGENMTQTNFTDNVFIDGSQDIKQLRVQGHTTQNQQLQTWEDSAGNIQAQVTGDGRLQVGDDVGLASPDALVEAHRADTSTSKPKRGIHSLGRVSGTLSTLVQWMVGELELRGSTAIDALHTALRIRASNMNTGTPTANAELRAADIEVINDATAGTAALTNATGLQVGVTNASGKTITNAYGLHVKMSNAGTIANPFAIYTEGPGVTHLEDYVEFKRPAATPGTPSTDFMRLYPKSDGKLYAKNWSGNEYDLTGGGVNPRTCDGRLTLSSGTPVPSSDIAAASTLYLTPFRGNQLTLFNGTNWALYNFSEISLSLSGLQANTAFDIFAYDNAGAVTLEAVAWNSPANGSITSISTARVVTVASHTLATGQLVSIGGNAQSANNGLWRVGTTTTTTFQLLNLDGTTPAALGSAGAGGTWQRADQNTGRLISLAVQDGVYVKSGALSRRYLGTIRTTEVTGQSEDSKSRRFVWNLYNAVPRFLKANDTTQLWTYATTAWRPANNNRQIGVDEVELVIGLDWALVQAFYDSTLYFTAAGPTVGIGLDNTAANNSVTNSYHSLASSYIPAQAKYIGFPGAGYHYLQALEYGGSGAVYGGARSTVTQSGLTVACEF